jgi:two-component system cell cycle sensor histidine kinase/response regulator CckA
MTRVLVVDDKEENLYYLRALLEADGREVDAARNGAEALALAERSPPALVISDLLMPVMDGYTLLRRWKSEPRLKQVPFIVYTATYVAREDEELALRLGADAFLLKPIEPEALLARVRAVEARPETTLPETPEPGEGTEPGLLREYSEVLIRKLEQKMVELDATNRALQRDIALREQAEATLRRTEEQLRQAQKMEAVGRLAGGVAHDFNNLLSVILGYTALILEEMKPDDPWRGELDAVLKAGDRAATLTRQLLAFSRLQVLEPRVLDLGHVVEELGKMLPALLGEDTELLLSTRRCTHRIHADPSQIEQIVMNLAVNARDAMPRGGKLTIETADVALDATFVERHPGVVPGPYVLLAVTDTGTGMDAATRERIFEPFFTTKERGKGTGLGLSTVFGIVKQSNGHVFVSSEPGRGTRFELYLPSTDLRAEADQARAPAGVLDGSETILLVEDDELVRAVNAKILRRSGYQVLEAPAGSEALLLSGKFAAPIHLLLTDVIMPRMSGRELAEHLARTRPETKTLYVSGHTNDSILHHGVKTSGVAFLQKPATPKALLRKVREILDAPPVSPRA